MAGFAVPTLFMPIQRCALAIPKTAIAEVIPYKPPMPSAGPRWLLGKLDWRGVKVPMMAFESLCGSPLPIFNAEARIAIVYNVGGNANEVPYFAILLQSAPSVMDLDADSVRPAEPEQPCEYVAGGVATEDRNGMIPDMEKIGRELNKLNIF